MISPALKVALRLDGERGLFAVCPIAKDEQLLTYDGPRIDRPTRTSIQIDERTHIDGTETSNAFLNHSCEPSAYVDWNGPVLRALRDIEAGEEITCNYLTTDFEIRAPFVCHCGSLRCFGAIRGWKYLDEEQRHPLRQFVAPFLRGGVNP